MATARTYSFCSIFFFILLVVAPADRLWGANARSETVTYYADSDLQDPKYGSFVQARRDHVNLNDLSQISLLTKDGMNILPYGEDDKIEVILFLPYDMEPQDENAFVSEIENHLNQKYKQAVYKVKRSYIPQNVIAPNDPTTQDWVDKTKQYARWIRQKSYEPEFMDLTMGSIIGASRSMASVGYWLSVSGLNIFGMTQASLALILGQIFSRYPTQINKWKAEHNIPFLKDNPLVHFYNSRPFAKTLIINELIAFVAQSNFRFLSHLARPAQIRTPLSTEFLGTFFAMSLVRTPLHSTGDVGLLTLLKKGYVTRRTAHYLYNLFAIESQISTLLFAGGKLRWLPIFLAIEWGTKSAVWGVARLLPPRHHRLMIVHPNISERDRDQIEYVHELRNLYLNEENVSAATLQELRSKYGIESQSPQHKSQPLQTLGVPEP